MNAKALFAVTVAVALLSSGVAMASEATQFQDVPSTQGRAQVKAELARARAAGELAGVSFTYGYFEPRAAVSVRSREAVRAEARAFGRKHEFNGLYVGA